MGIYDGMRSEEHSKIVKRGLKRLTDQGVRLGPPNKATPVDIDLIIKMRRQGKPYTHIAYTVGLSVGLVHKLVRLFSDQVYNNKPYILLDLVYR